MARGAADSSEIIVIPLTVDNESLSAVIVAEEDADGYDTDCYTSNGYLYNICHGAGIDVANAQNKLGLFMYMENRVWGKVRFYHIPFNIFPDISGDTLTDNTRAIEIFVASHDSTSNGFMGMACWIAPSGICNCADPSNCDWRSGCSYCSMTYCEPPGGGTGGGGGGGGNPPPPGGGGYPGGPPPPGGGGGGNNPAPPYPGGGGGCVPDLGDGAWYNSIIMPPNPCDPPPPPPVPPPPTDTCDAFIGILQNDTAFANKFKYLNTNAVLGLDNEVGYEVRSTNDSISYIYKAGKPDDPFIDWSLPANTLTKGLLHSHYAVLIPFLHPKM